MSRLGWLLLAGSLGAARAQGFAYEVAAIRPNTSGSQNMSVESTESVYVTKNSQLSAMISEAFELQTLDQVVGLPGWAGAAHYDINAKMDVETVARLKALKSDDRDKAEDDMMLKLLVDRFGLKYHRETRELPEFALVQVKGGAAGKPGFKVADPTNPKANGMTANNGKMEGYSMDIPRLTYFLSYQSEVHRPIVDKTGLTGKYDVTLTWTREAMMNSGADGTTERAPGLFTALQEQMGLKLEAIKGKVDVVVIDHIEQPTEN